MSISNFDQYQPKLGDNVYVAASAEVIGQVALADDCSVWPQVVIRGDVNSISIGARSNIQDGSVLHVTHKTETNPAGHPLVIGSDVTVGHRVVLHGCIIGDECLIGINSVVLDGAIIENQVLLAANSLVAPGKRLKSGYLYMGSPAKAIRELTAAEKAHFKYSAEHYITLQQHYQA